MDGDFLSLVSENDQKIMRVAIKEAKKGIGRTSPNPCVGAVIVKDNEIIATGYHQRAGEPHAEVNAITAAGKRTKDSTIYVTLEPCNHQGRTPPCTQAIIAAGIKRVVVGMEDPNLGVKGSGNDFLRQKGVQVSSGVLADICEELNQPFIKHIQTGVPWIICKAGMSLDGRIATRTGNSNWITGEKSRAEVHRLRDRVDAIMIGIDTAIADDPSLTTRLPSKPGKDPVRVILDTDLRMNPEARMLRQKSSSSTLIFCSPDPVRDKQKSLEEAGAHVYPVKIDTESKRLDLTEVFKKIGDMQLNSVLVEGGASLHGEVLRQGLADEAYLFYAPVFIGGDGFPVAGGAGVEMVSDARRLKIVKSRRFGDDILLICRFGR
jgi:diaminohydroxyphosphoribosylaminopyrimidine deaminase / 5-amino-6-(5-phosphoribosylamino)uracil reductase